MKKTLIATQQVVVSCTSDGQARAIEDLLRARFDSLGITRRVSRLVEENGHCFFEYDTPTAEEVAYEIASAIVDKAVTTIIKERA